MIKITSGGSQLTEQILYWSYYEPSLHCEVSCCIIRTAQNILLVDPLPMDAQVLSSLEAFGIPTAILLTNGNHQRASLKIQKRWNIPIFAEERARKELVADEWIKKDQMIWKNLSLLHLPGAGAGEIAIFQEKSFCVFGDFLIHVKPEQIELLPEKYCGNSLLARKSLVQLQGLDVPLLLFAHGRPIAQDASLQLKQFLEKINPLN